MQIEELIGGENGDTSAQAIQLRMRSGGQGVVNQASIWASDANGGNRTLLLNISGNVTTNTAAGSRILLTTTAFNNAMIQAGITGFTSDFQLAVAIPASFLNAGKITFEQDGGTTSTPGTIYWSLAWGGSNYTGTNTGNSTNGTFGTAFGSALPTSAGKGIIFNGAATAASTDNSTQYIFTANNATVTNNAGTAFTVVPEPGTVALLGAFAFGAIAILRRRA